MLAKAKGTVVVGCVLLCTLSLLGSRPNLPPRPRGSLPLPPAGAAGTVPVLVEAFVVEVNLPALADLDVSPIGQEPHAVSVDDILKCLGTGQARVIGGSKAGSQPEAKAEVEAREAVRVANQPGMPPEARRSTYELSKRLSVTVNPVSETAVSVSFSIVQAGPIHGAQTSDVPSETGNRTWSGATTLELGRPRIAAATQNSETAVFLILTAHAQSE